MAMNSSNFLDLTVEELQIFEKPTPRYTSYPSVPLWQPLDTSIYEKKLLNLSKALNQPLSIYIHVPFCKNMCLFCGCHVILNRRLDIRQAYADWIEQEIDLVFSKLAKQQIEQLHLGGGTPTYMPLDRIQSWLDRLRKYCTFSNQAEISIEIDPRTVIEAGPSMLVTLKAMGFNRLSFGVQDIQEDVQEAVRRRQSCQMSETTLLWARQNGFNAFNLDLIYGLPRQNLNSFSQTAAKVVEWKPSRIALFSYAKVPWIKAHQKAIKEYELPSSEEKLQLYLIARQQFLQAGYEQIGMDHFALPTDELAIAYYSEQLQRNFQGYSLKRADNLIGLGVSSTGFVDGLYVQNVKELEAYKEALDQNRLPIFRGKSLNDEDKRRYWVIQMIMCNFAVHFKDYNKIFSRDFKSDFHQELSEIIELEKQGLVNLHPQKITATSKGRVFIRLVAAIFDAYLKANQTQQRFSMSI
jgi:oxygen-independent coproporphyrinogen-3 oxidase